MAIFFMLSAIVLVMEAAVAMPYEDQSRLLHKKKKKRRPCRKLIHGRTVLGLTFLLGDVVVNQGSIPCTQVTLQSGGLFNGGLLSGLGLPSLFGQGGLFGGNRPLADAVEAAPVHEDIPEDEVVEDEYTPGPLVGAPSHQVNGYMQNLNNAFSTPSRFVQGIGKGINSYFISPFVDLLHKKR